MTEDDTGSRGGSDGDGGEHDSRKCGMASTRGDGRGNGMGCKATANVLKAGSSVAYGEAQANVLWELVKAGIDLPIVARPTLDSREVLTRITQRETRRVMVFERERERRRDI